MTGVRPPPIHGPSDSGCAIERLAVVALLTLPGSLFAQASGVPGAAASITEADFNHKVEVIAHDSMMGRDTPSPGLDTDGSVFRVSGGGRLAFGPDVTTVFGAHRGRKSEVV